MTTTELDGIESDIRHIRTRIEVGRLRGLSLNEQYAKLEALEAKVAAIRRQSGGSAGDPHSIYLDWDHDTFGLRKKLGYYVLDLYNDGDVPDGVTQLKVSTHSPYDFGTRYFQRMKTFRRRWVSMYRIDAGATDSEG